MLELCQTQTYRTTASSRKSARAGCRKDKAFEWLEKDFPTRSGNLATIRWQIPYESLRRDDPRFAGLLKRMNLPE